MKTDGLAKLFGSTARVRLLRLFLFSPRSLFSVQDAAERTRSGLTEVSREIKSLLTAKVIRRAGGKKIRFSLDPRFPYLEALQNLLLTMPLQENTMHERFTRVGGVKLIVLAGSLAGDAEGRLDLLVVGERMKDRVLRSIVRALEADIGKELRYASMTSQDFRYRLDVSDRLVRDIFDYPHRVALNKLDITLK